MPTLDLDFKRIRQLAGSQHHAFEELCTQLGSLEPRAAGSIFYRKGPGADAGVECYVQHATGDETAWQAKYFDKFGNTQIGELDKSISQALNKHARITRYIVCLPIDLRDARAGKAQSQLQRWQAWVKKWERVRRKPRLKIELWGRSELLERVGRDDPLYSGRAAFWFDETFLTRQWFAEKFAAAKDSLGERYTPETNIKLPIRRALLAFCRDPSLMTEIEEWWQGIEEKGHDAIQALERVPGGKNLKEATNKLRQAVSALSAALWAIQPDPTAAIPVERLKDLANKGLEAVWSAQRAIWDFKTDQKEDQERAHAAQDRLRNIDEVFETVLSAVTSDRWAIVNGRRLLVKGAAGVGKSHLFGDAVDHLVQNERPALLILSGTLIEDDPWSQIIKQLGLDLTPDHFLGSLDAAAQAANTRAVIFIDAINEHHGIALWSRRLPAFLRSIEHFPRVAVTLSCRSTYLPYILPHNVEQLSQIEHVGFAGRAAEASRFYLDRRGIARMAAPNLIPEFENPLFLKTCCDYLDKEGLKEIPRGLRGVTDIFAFYTAAVARSVEARLGLDRNLRIVERALEAFASALDASERGYMDYDIASGVLEPFLPSHGSFERSLLPQFISEGILSTEPVGTADGGVKQIVRFTFERYSDHRIARRLLDLHLDTSDPKKSFLLGTSLNDYLNGAKAYERAGVIEAMAIQLPERCGLELADALPKPHRNSLILTRAHIDSALWRAQKTFTRRTLELLKQASRLTGQDEPMRALLAVASEPENAFNARHLHGLLTKMAMPERDQRWSIYIAQEGAVDDSPIETLITWTLQNGFGAIDDTRAELAGIALTWLFTTSHRAIRDRATKALSALLAPRLRLAAKLLELFKAVEDLYVHDRLLASCYGGALQGIATDGLADLAQVAFTWVFDRSTPIVHVLVRDYARGIVELAHARGLLPATIALGKARPPYRSPWPIEDVPNSVIETYTQDYPGGHRHRDGIVSSVVNDGDFARYVVDGAVNDFSVLPIAWAGRGEEEIYREWAKALPEENAGAVDKLHVLLKATQTWRERQGPLGLGPLRVKIILVKPGDKEKDRRSSLEKKVDKAEHELQIALGEDGWRRYCAEARAYVRRDLRGANRIYPWPPQFDTRLARRWICKRAHDLGWTGERFGEFDHNISSERTEHRLERIGKKYQWIAFHELMARLGDNCAFMGWSRQNGTRLFDGPWEVHRRNIDPSLLVLRASDEDWRKEDVTWWLPARVNLKPISPASRVAWLDSTDDVINGPELIAVTQPTSGRRWLVLEGHADWTQWGIRDGDRKLDRTLFVYVRSLVTRAEHLSKLVRELSGRSLLGSHNLPEIERPSECFIGEYPWHPLFKDMPSWVGPSEWNKIGIETLPTVTEYLAERGGYDYSIEKTISCNLPAPGLISGMRLHLSSGRELAYATNEGSVHFFDPSVNEAGPSAALVNRDAFTAFLEKENLATVWIITGEKSVYGGVGYHPEGFGGRRNFTSIYWMKGDSFAQNDHFGREDPSTGQLAKLYAETGELPQKAIKLRAPVKRRSDHKGKKRATPLTGHAQKARKKKRKRTKR